MGVLLVGFLLLQFGTTTKINKVNNRVKLASSQPIAQRHGATARAGRGSARSTYPAGSLSAAHVPAVQVADVVVAQAPVFDVSTTSTTEVPATTTTSTTSLPVTTTTAKPKPKPKAVVETPVSSPSKPSTAPPASPPSSIGNPASSSGNTDSGADGVWTRLAQCEAGGRNDGGAPYFGYFQFSEGTWIGLGGTGFPNDHTYDEQKAMAQKLQARSGWGQWPVCSRVAGAR